MCLLGQKVEGLCSSLQHRDVDKMKKKTLGLAKHLLHLPGSDMLLIQLEGARLPPE